MVSSEVSVARFMDVSVPRLNAGMPLSLAVQVLAQATASCVIVVNEEAPVGILTEADCVRLFAEGLAGRGFDSVCLREVMSERPFTVQRQHPIEQALSVARNAGVRHLPVTDDRGHCVGVLERDMVLQSLMDEGSGTASGRGAVEEKLQALIDANNQLQEASLEDPLTGAGNRRAMTVDLKYADRLKGRYGNDYSVLLLDVDFFKKYNDHYGHAAGDEVLRQVAKALQGAIRDCDRLFRYGGEEFLVLLPETGCEGALVPAERLVEGVAGLGIPHEKSDHRVVTISCGVATSGDANEGWERVVERADQGLYRAKEQGRNGFVALSADEGKVVTAA